MVEKHSLVGWPYYRRRTSGTEGGRCTLIDHTLSERVGRIRLMLWGNVRGVSPKSPLYQRTIGYYKLGIFKDRLKHRTRPWRDRTRWSR